MKANDRKTLVWHSSHVEPTDRYRLFGQRPVTVWLTGLSGAGKSTLATALEARLTATGHASVVLDGDNIRHGLCHDLGFSDADRSENIRRVAEVAKLMNDAGLIVITAFISPFIVDREMAARIVGYERFREVHIAASLDVCEQRDPKGFYQRARRGEIREFTGISAPYEPPEAPALALDTGDLGVDDCIERLLACISDFLEVSHLTS